MQDEAREDAIGEINLFEANTLVLLGRVTVEIRKVVTIGLSL